VTCGKTGSHEEDELGKGNSARDLEKAHISRKGTHVIDINERVNSTTLIVVLPLASLANDIIKHRGEDWNGSKTDIQDQMPQHARSQTVFYTGFGKDFGIPLDKDKVQFLVLRRGVYIVGSGRLIVCRGQWAARSAIRETQIPSQIESCYPPPS
jgi:hypothetical protein